MDLSNQQIKICKLDSNSSKAKKVHNIFELNPYNVFNINEMAKIYNQTYLDNASNRVVSTIITRLYAKNKLIRTPTQLNSGYLYSVSNKQKIEEIHRNHLLPYDFEDNQKILDLITQSKFQKLKTDQTLNLNQLKNQEFIEKYGLNYFYNQKVLNFLTTNIGFLMCDGHIRKNLLDVKYFFNQEKDAKDFMEYFNSIFRNEKLYLKYHSYCFRIRIGNKRFSRLMNHLGVPKGNKVFQPFLVPGWIYNGSNELKRTFLSIIYGNEGAKPQDNRWRIQFVLSKNKEYVPNLLEFLNQIRTMLYHFSITSSHIQLRKQKGRQFCGRFYIKGKENLLKFYKGIGFAYASEKQEVLESLLRRNKLIN